MKHLDISILLLAGVYLCDSFGPSPQISYYEVLFDKCDIINMDTNFQDWSDVKVKKINKTRSLNGDVVLKRDFGNEIKTKIDFYIKRGGEYQLLPYKIDEKGLCQFFQEDKYFYKDLAANSDFPEDVENTCPLKAGKYTLRQVTFSLKNLPKTIIANGDYSTDLIQTFEGEEIFRYRCYASLVTA